LFDRYLSLPEEEFDTPLSAGRLLLRDLLYVLFPEEYLFEEYLFEE